MDTSNIATESARVAIEMEDTEAAHFLFEKSLQVLNKRKGTLDNSGGSQKTPTADELVDEILASSEKCCFSVSEHFKGCAILDSGATSGVSSLAAADDIQMQRMERNEPGISTLSKSGKRFKFGDGGASEIKNKIDQPITSGILAGTTLPLHLVDKEGNTTLPLFPISEMRQQGMVIDYSENKVSFKTNPNKWYKLPTTGAGGTGLMMIPLTAEACEKFDAE